MARIFFHIITLLVNFIILILIIIITRMANVSVLSKLVKFFHPINPTRQYPACVLSTHRIQTMLLSYIPISISIFHIYQYQYLIYRYININNISYILHHIQTMLLTSISISISIFLIYYTISKPCYFHQYQYQYFLYITRYPNHTTFINININISCISHHI